MPGLPGIAFTARFTLVTLVVTASAACRALGYTDRVLLRQPSPDGQFVAVCQEVPVFDGPTYDVRLERPDGQLVRPLSRLGDAAPCDEIAWSPDGRLLGVLNSGVARIVFLDVAWALEHRSASTPWRQVDLWSRVLSRNRSEHLWVRGRELRFVEPLTVEIHLCPHGPSNFGHCSEPEAVHRFAVPLPTIWPMHRVTE